jgi:cellulose biosynthesis protein BcsQ
MFIDEDRLGELWDNQKKGSIADSLVPLVDRTGDILDPHIEMIGRSLGVVPGNLALSRFEDLLSENWPKCLAGDIGAFRVITAFYRILFRASEMMGADVVLIDVGPNLGAINRSSIIAADFVVLPLAPDLFSLQGLKNLGPTLRDWRRGWKKRLDEFPGPKTIKLPEGRMEPTGYIVMQHAVRENRPVKAYQRWMNRIPAIYRESVLEEPSSKPLTPEQDPYNLAHLKHYRSLMPLAQEAHKPMFFLKPSDGAIGAHVEAVRDCYRDFFQLAARIAVKADLSLREESE